MVEIFQEKPIPLIYILGSGHSGSTLLDLMLGSHSRIESGGEIDKYQGYFAPDSKRALRKRVCTCGLQVASCPYWNAVTEKIKKHPAAEQEVLDNVSPDRFTANNYILIKSILEVAEKDIFCDSSKDFNRLNLYLLSPSFQLTIVHLVRDGRAVAFSLKRKKKSYYADILSWQQKNLKHHFSLNNKPNYLLLRYEDLVADPRESLKKILNRLNCVYEENQLSFYQQEHHNLSGNRMRMEKESGIRHDLRYLKELSSSEWSCGTLLAWPGLRRFGYSLSRSKESDKY